ncbi:unnamed protein product [Rhizoctonia solani]|uniref:Uncharacterized protein n=1 Tax=Rhizoctonia solani TaxID=456999 RepID=A0A8H3CDP7_9AGAM|nr:unnamed protein product [Rhizoctonia solani]
MPTIQFRHDMDACSSSPSISASLSVKHTIEINGASQQPVEIQSPSLGLLRAMKLGPDLRIELMCLLEDASVPPIRVRAFPFVSALLASLQEATWGAAGLYQTGEHEKSDEVLRHFIALRHDSETSEAPRLCLRSLELTLSLPGRIHEFAQGLHAFDLYSVLESPPLPLQLCFDDLRSQLLAHLAFCYPSLIGEHAKALRKNTEYLNSILTSLSRIFDRSANDSLKRQARLHQLRLIANARSRLQNQAGVLDSTGASIEGAIASNEGGTAGLARSINQDICCVWLQLQSPVIFLCHSQQPRILTVCPKQEKQGNISMLVQDTDELEIHEDLPEPAPEDEDSRGDTIIDIDSDGEFNVPWEYHLPSPAPSILDTNSPPTSPY